MGLTPSGRLAAYKRERIAHRARHLDHGSEGRIRFVGCEQPSDHLGLGLHLPREVGLRQPTFFPYPVEGSHESIDRVDLAPRIRVGGSKVTVLHPLREVAIEARPGGFAHDTQRNIWVTLEPSQPSRQSWGSRSRKAGDLGALADYEFNKKHIHHLFCSTCGIKSFARGTGPNGAQIVAVNARCLDDVDLGALNVKSYDGTHK
jgi:hypothetical protein